MYDDALEFDYQRLSENGDQVILSCFYEDLLTEYYDLFDMMQRIMANSNGEEEGLESLYTVMLEKGKLDTAM